MMLGYAKADICFLPIKKLFLQKKKKKEKKSWQPWPEDKDQIFRLEHLSQPAHLLLPYQDWYR